MPIYEYQCGACGATAEFIQKFNESAKRKCPECGALKLKKLVSAAAFHLKGSGWYVTDFRDKGKPGKDAKKGGGESKTETKSDAKDSKTETKSDSKSETKSASKKSDTKSAAA